MQIHCAIRHFALLKRRHIIFTYCLLCVQWCYFWFGFADPPRIGNTTTQTGWTADRKRGRVGGVGAGWRGGGADFLQCETLYCIAGSETVIQVQMQKVHSQAEVCMQKMHKHCA